jgi:hypothetical protein
MAGNRQLTTENQQLTTDYQKVDFSTSVRSAFLTIELRESGFFREPVTGAIGRPRKNSNVTGPRTHLAITFATRSLPNRLEIIHESGATLVSAAPT